MWGLSKFSLGALALFAFNQFLELFISIPYVHAYLDDLLCAPIVMGGALWIFQKVILQDEHFTFHWSFGVIFIAVYAMLFEVLYPIYDQRHFSDPLDVIAYAVGTFSFFYWGNRSLKR